MITAYEDVGTVVSAMKLGAYDYVVKPLNMEGLLTGIRNGFESIKMRKEIQALQERCLKENFPCFIGESDAVQDVMDVVRKVAQSPDTPILIQGETGTGKELIVSAIHYRSPNFRGPLVTVNCAAIPKGLIESELFGYEKGAFSGADTSGKMGLVEKAADGTLFLDEVGDLSMEAQAKLLRFIEEGECYRVGGTRKRKVRTRVISATNRDLEQMVADGGFRRDLYYRLAVVKVAIPSLNDRGDDIMPMARHFMVELNRKFGRSLTGISPEAEQALERFHWKGNVRELRNVMERAVLLADGPELTPRDLGLEEVHRAAPQPENNLKPPSIPDSGIDISSVLESFERHCIEESLRMANGNESKAARLLQLSRDTFRYRRRRHQVA
jgi:DNA-binding NtrC family response regulator